MEVKGSQLQLQKAVIDIPAGHDLTGLTFVCKSKDGTMWWRDGQSAICPCHIVLVNPCHMILTLLFVHAKHLVDLLLTFLLQLH